MPVMYGVAMRPKFEKVQKKKILNEYYFKQCLSTNEKLELKIMESDQDISDQEYNEGDFFVFVGRKDLYYLGMSNTIRDLLETDLNIHILPFTK